MDDALPTRASTRFQVLPADVTAAYRANLRWRYTRARAWAWPVLLAVLLIVVRAAMDPAAPPLALVEPAAVILALAVVFKLGYYLAMPLYAARQFRERVDLHQEWEVEMSADGLLARSPGQEIRTSWTTYVAWSRNSRVALVYQSDRLFQFMPIRARTPEIEAVFRHHMGHKPRR